MKKGGGKSRRHVRFAQNNNHETNAPDKPRKRGKVRRRRGRRSSAQDVWRRAAYGGRGAHFDSGDNPHGGEERQQRRAAVAEERQRDSDNGHDEQAHPDIDDGLEHEHGGDSHADVAMERRDGVPGDNQDTDDNRQEQEHDDKATHKPEFLPAHGENEVGMPPRKRLLHGALRLRALHIALPEEAARTERQHAPMLLPAAPQRVIVVVEHDNEAFLLVQRYQVHAPSGVGRAAYRAEQDQKPSQRESGGERHADEDEKEHNAVAHVAGNGDIHSH